MIKDVILWQNGMVMVFDEKGQQIPEYQGRVEDVKESIDKVFKGRWTNGDWKTKRLT